MTGIETLAGTGVSKTSSSGDSGGHTPTRDRSTYASRVWPSSKDAAAGSKRLAARDLLRRVIGDYPDSLDVVVAHEALGELDEKEGAYEAAEAHYKAALHLSLDGNVHGDAHLCLPELLIRTGQVHKFADAEAVLATINVQQDLVFSSQRFRYAVCRARLAVARDDAEEASRHATAALHEAAIDAPDFPRHPDLERVHADRSLLREMRVLARTSS